MSVHVNAGRVELVAERIRLMSSRICSRSSKRMTVSEFITVVVGRKSASGVRRSVSVAYQNAAQHFPRFPGRLEGNAVREEKAAT